MEEHPGDAVAVAAVHALTNAIRRSSASTLMEIQVHIKSAAEQLQERKTEAHQAIQLQAVCQIFVRYVTRTALDLSDLRQVREMIIDRGEHFSEQSLKCRHTIAELGSRFVHDGEVVLTHGFSNVVVTLLLHAAKMGRRFRVIVTEANPGSDGQKTVERLRAAKLRADLIIDSAVGHVMENVDMVVVGAQGVVENGGIINKIGTNQISIVAQANKKPFYVAAESYKFARMYPLNQSDLPEIEQYTYRHSDDNNGIRQPILDYTPPQYITLLFTDLGVLTPSAVSDELIKLYY